MADAAIFVGFGTPARGREQKALQVFNESLQYYGSLQAQGQIESFEPVLLQAHGGDLGGFILLRGEREKLDAAARSDEFRRLVARAGLIVDSLGVVTATIGEDLTNQMALYGEQLGELAS